MTFQANLAFSLDQELQRMLHAFCQQIESSLQNFAPAFDAASDKLSLAMPGFLIRTKYDIVCYPNK